MSDTAAVPEQNRVRPIRIVVVDNSTTIRRVLVDGLRARGFEVVGEAHDGVTALRMLELTRPDAVTLDYVMPNLDGAGVLAEMTRLRLEIPVVVVSSVIESAAARAVDLLAQGAVDVVAKPLPGTSIVDFLDELEAKLRVAAQAHIGAYDSQQSAGSIVAAEGRSRGLRPAHLLPRGGRSQRIVVVASSTGGPQTLACLLRQLPPDFTSGMVLVQHMPAEFTPRLAERLDRETTLQVREAREYDELRSGTVLLAPGGRHLRITGRGSVELSDDPAVGGLRPRADVTILDAVEHYGDDVVLVILTGMGSDGLEGARRVRAAGGTVIAESQDSAVLYGMPRAVIGAGLANHELPARKIAQVLAREVARE